MRFDVADVVWQRAYLPEDRGTVVEDVSVNDFLNQGTTHHPYTQLLWDASRYVAGVQPTMTMPPARRSDLSERDLQKLRDILEPRG